MADDRTDAGPTLIQSVRRAVWLLDSLERRGGAGTAKQLAREVMLPLPTTYHLLRTLAHEGLVRNDNGVYALTRPVRPNAAGDELVAMGVQGWVDQLSRDLHAAVYFVQYQEGEVVVAAVSDNPAAPPVAEWADFKATAHAHAAGRCLLLQLEAGDRADHLSRHPVTPLTPHTAADRRTLERGLAGLSRRLPVLEYQEYAMGSACAAVPITVGSSTAALALSVPAARGAHLRPMATRLQTSAEQVLMSRTFAVATRQTGH
ncbi:helix-turn-helix domain-containing protein [Streptomyces sp. SBC-4]|nr:helix-turn-helix domain-containing protein [Streptomyces sp. SBC-4]MDV5145422.1 helix-turn-helix domain-containing protein [Streptomyces sp. SBC-4]